jgi:hypothetical protein
VGRSIQSIEVCSKSSRKKEAEKNFTVSVKTPNGTEEKATLKGLQEWLVSVVPRDKNEPPCLRVNKTHESGPL